MAVKLLDIGRNWNMLIQSIPNMLNSVLSIQGMGELDIISFQELCEDPCAMGLCIIML